MNILYKSVPNTKLFFKGSTKNCRIISYFLLLQTCTYFIEMQWKIPTCWDPTLCVVYSTCIYNYQVVVLLTSNHTALQFILAVLIFQSVALEYRASIISFQGRTKYLTCLPFTTSTFRRKKTTQKYVNRFYFNAVFTIFIKINLERQTCQKFQMNLLQELQ